MNIYPDPVLLILQAIPFALLIFILQKLVFVPFAEYLGERDSATIGAREEALRLQREAEAHLARYQERLAEARAEAQRIHAERRKVAKAERDAALAAARAEADKLIEDALDTIAGERELAAEELRRLARGLGADIAAQVLGRSGAPAVVH